MGPTIYKMLNVSEAISKYSSISIVFVIENLDFPIICVRGIPKA